MKEVDEKFDESAKKLYIREFMGSHLVGQLQKLIN